MLRRFGLFSIPGLGMILVLLSMAAYAQEPAAAPKAPVAAPAMRAPGGENDRSYRLGPGDIIDVRVFGRPEMTSQARIDSFGRVRLPFTDEMQAACLTEAQLAELITEKYKKYLRNPQVDVMIKEYRSQPVAVIGAVTQPGRFQLQRRVRLLELITQAGGPTIHAGATVNIIHSTDHDYCPTGDEAKAEAAQAPSQDGESPIPLLSMIKLKQVLTGEASANPYVKPGDIISIPEADQFFVTGSVVKPGAYPMVTQITLTQAVALAGGINGEGARNRVRLVRQEPGKDIKTENIYNLDDIHRRKIQDIVLQVNDIVEVPGSTVRVAARNLLGVSINMLSALPFFIIP